MFFHQLKLHRMDHSFKKLLEELHLMWDEYGIPYNKRKRLLLVEVEMVSLLMCDVLPYNYSEQGIWVNDKSQGQYYNFFRNKMPIRQLKTYSSLQRRLTGNAKHPRSTGRQELRPGQKRIKSIRSEPQNPLKSHIYPIDPARYATTAHTDK